MDKATVLREILKHRAEFEAAGVTHVYLFGSTVRGEAAAGSDVDLMFDHSIERFDILDYSGLKILADDLLPFKVDFINRDTMHPKIRARAEAQAERVF